MIPRTSIADAVDHGLDGGTHGNTIAIERQRKLDQGLQAPDIARRARTSLSDEHLSTYGRQGLERLDRDAVDRGCSRGGCE